MSVKVTLPYRYATELTLMTSQISYHLEIRRGGIWTQCSDKRHRVSHSAYLRLVVECEDEYNAVLFKLRFG